jgi:predicted MFS family arabinose efflux permease
MFAIFQMMANIGIASGEGIATALSDNIGFSNVFRLLALFNVLLIPLLIVVLRRFTAEPDGEAETPYAVFDDAAEIIEGD